MDYLIRHWRGRLPLWQAFWINLVLLTLVIGLLELALYRTLMESPRQLAWGMAAWFAVFHILAFIWQATGVLRKCEFLIGQHVHTTWPKAAQLGVLVAFAMVMIWGVSLLQYITSTNADRLLRTESIQRQPDYSLRIDADRLAISGPLAPGITRDTRELLARNPAVRTIILNSKGGNVYEARGLAKLIQEEKLDTLAEQHCYSACTTAYLAGHERYLVSGAKLGFHQYRLDTDKLLPPYVNTDYEQSRDLEYFRSRGIDPAFLEKVFALDPRQMWLPETDELLRAGIVTRLR